MKKVKIIINKWNKWNNGDCVLFVLCLFCVWDGVRIKKVELSQFQAVLKVEINEETAISRERVQKIEGYGTTAIEGSESLEAFQKFNKDLRK